MDSVNISSLKKMIEIKEDFKIPGSDIVLEKGDKIKILEMKRSTNEIVDLLYGAVTDIRWEINKLPNADRLEMDITEWVEKYPTTSGFVAERMLVVLRDLEALRAKVQPEV